MQKFYYFLSDNPSYPNVLMATNKNEVKKILLEDLGPHGSEIISILSEEEFNKKMNIPIQKNNFEKSTVINKSAIYADSTEYDNSANFMNDVIQAATAVAINSDSSNNLHANNECKNDAPPAPRVEFIDAYSKDDTNNLDIKYFEESGIQFKFEKGILYKRVWTEISDQELNEFRIINAKTNRKTDISKFKLERLVWKKI